jgi:MSHA pilin protein MshD
MRPKHLSREQGVTLVELVMSIMIISISMIGILSVVNITNKHSADPLITYQALAIAESYMDEILLQNYAGTVATIRANYNNVDNYNNLVNSPPQDQQGVSITGLAAYTASISVSAPTSMNGVLVKQISISVSGPGATTVTLVGYRAAY